MPVNKTIEGVLEKVMTLGGNTRGFNKIKIVIEGNRERNE